VVLLLPSSTPPLVFFLSVLFCFSSPSLVLLALAALMVAEWRCCCGCGKETQRWCPGGEERSFFFFVLRPPISVLLFPTYAFAFSPLSLKKIPRLVSLSPLFFSQSLLSFKQFFLFSHLLLLLSSLAIRPPRLPFFPPTFFCTFLCIYRKLGRGSPYPV